MEGLDDQKLVDDFGGGQIPDKTFGARCAEGTAHWAANLAGNANAGAVFVWKKDRLYDFIIVEGQEVFNGAIDGLLFANNLTASDGVVFSKSLP